MPTPSWDQKRRQIAQTMRGAFAPGGLSLGNAGAMFRTNPMMSFGRPAAAAPAAPASGGLMGQAGGGGQMARMAQMPGFNYVPPPTGPAPVPQQQGPMGNGAMSMDDVKWLLLGGTGPGQRLRQGDAGGYSTSGRGGGRSSSWGGGQRGGGGLY